MSIAATGARFVWETHGIHAGTDSDHVKHGVDDLEAVAEEALRRGHPGVTFIIHSPRLTGVRYRSERDTEIKFIRGDKAYSEYPDRMRALRERYRGRLEVRYGVELEWQSGELGLQWARSKIFQCRDADFVVGSVHFSREGLPYDGSPEEAALLLEARGGPEAYWAGYLEEMIEMVDRYRDLIHVVGHLDLPKLRVPAPEAMFDLENSRHPLARRLRMLLELVAEADLALDLNLAGARKGCGAYPHDAVLERAARLRIPVALGSDAHSLEELGAGWDEGADTLAKAGYSYYLSFAGGIAEKRPLDARPGLEAPFRLLNKAVGMLGQRLPREQRRGIPGFSFGGAYRELLGVFDQAVSLGEFDAIRARKLGKFVTVSDSPPAVEPKVTRYLYSRHRDVPGTMAVIFNTLASEGINIETAYLRSLHDGTGTAYLTVSASDGQLSNAIAFVLGTAGERFLELSMKRDDRLPEYNVRGTYLLEIDGVELLMPVSPRMIVTVHDDKPGTLLILLSALASKRINVVDMQLGARGSNGYAALGVEGDDATIELLLSRLGDRFCEASFLRVDDGWRVGPAGAPDGPAPLDHGAARG